MATDTRTPEQVRHEIESEREQLARAVAQLRDGMDVSSALRAKLPVLAAGAVAAGFVFAGGIGATMRLLMRKSREGETKARLGRFRLVDRD
jgi:Protein of unknown function (DUF3618)